MVQLGLLKNNGVYNICQKPGLENQKQAGTQTKSNSCPQPVTACFFLFFEKVTGNHYRLQVTGVRVGEASPSFK